jgi:hypothetical protein
VATGKQRCPFHNAFGYSYYLNHSQEIAGKTPKINLAIRTEHLAVDWDKLETGFGGKVSENVSGNVRFAHPPVSQTSPPNRRKDANLGRHGRCGKFRFFERTKWQGHARISLPESDAKRPGVLDSTLTSTCVMIPTSVLGLRKRSMSSSGFVSATVVLPTSSQELIMPPY